MLPAWYVLTLPWPWRVAIVAAVIAAGIWICGASARRLGRHDHPGIVLDEVAGVLLTVLVLPAPSFSMLLLAFVFFRIFDIWKPWPIRDLDHSVPGGLGIMLDDLTAAVYAAVCLTVFRVLLPTI